MSRFVAPFALACAAVAAALLAGCGGGFFIGIGDGFDGDPPSVSLAAPPSAAAGQTIRLSAAAADDIGIERVDFYRIDAAADVLLGSDAQSPYALDAAVPAGAAGSVEFFARAIDAEGHVTDSSVVAVAILP